jgi:ATP-binding cassette subfamily G (WHITE) protein 2 (SNQ2)
MSIEFHGDDIPCAGPYLIPTGPSYLSGEGGQSCAGVGGARVGATSVSGDDYLASMSFSHGHLWRNFGILCAWWIFFVAVTMVFTSRWRQVGEGGNGLLVSNVPV